MFDHFGGNLFSGIFDHLFTGRRRSFSPSDQQDYGAEWIMKMLAETHDHMLGLSYHCIITQIGPATGLLISPPDTFSAVPFEVCIAPDVRNVFQGKGEQGGVTLMMENISVVHDFHCGEQEDKVIVSVTKYATEMVMVTILLPKGSTWHFCMNMQKPTVISRKLIDELVAAEIEKRQTSTSSTEDSTSSAPASSAPYPQEVHNHPNDPLGEGSEHLFDCGYTPVQTNRAWIRDVPNTTGTRLSNSQMNTQGESADETPPVATDDNTCDGLGDVFNALDFERRDGNSSGITMDEGDMVIDEAAVTDKNDAEISGIQLLTAEEARLTEAEGIIARATLFPDGSLTPDAATSESTGTNNQ